jgi:cytochrome c-type biogenesis protein CcmH/NrfG
LTDNDPRTKLEFIEGLVDSLRSAPREPELWANVADLLLEAGQFEKSVRAYDMALLLDPRLHRAKIGLTVALDLCDEDMSHRETPQLRSAVWEVLQVLETLVRGLREGRRSLFVDVHALRLQKETARRLAKDPNDPDATFLRSAFLAKQGAFEEAIALLDKLAARGVEYPGAAEFREQLKAMTGASTPRTARPRK